jgi:hypothetical protein
MNPGCERLWGFRNVQISFGSNLDGSVVKKDSPEKIKKKLGNLKIVLP